MVTFNHTAREMVLKIVYYGPGLCGKTTNLQTIHERLPEKDRTKMVSINTDTDRTLFFDMMGIKVGTIGGFKTKVQLFTVPGQVFYNETRKLVLNGADGVVFVADSQEAVMDSNIESLDNLALNLKKNGYDIDSMPLVFQWNKQDMPSASSPAELARALNPDGRPAFASVATTGQGVFETLKAITKLTVEDVRARYFVGGRLQEDRLDFSGSTRKGAKLPDPEAGADELPGQADVPGQASNVVPPGAETLDLNGVDDEVARGLVESRNPEVTPEGDPDMVRVEHADPAQAPYVSSPEALEAALNEATGVASGPSTGEISLAVAVGPGRSLTDDDPTEAGRRVPAGPGVGSGMPMAAEIAVLAPAALAQVGPGVVPGAPNGSTSKAIPRPVLALPRLPKPVALPAKPAPAFKPVLPRLPVLARPGGKCLVVNLPEGLARQGEVLVVSVSISKGEKILGQVHDSIVAPGIGESTSMTLRIQEQA